jgi:hypothetical protein
MSDGEQRSEFELRVRQALLDSSEAVDGATRSKLSYARHAALGAGGRRRRGWLGLGWHSWAPAGAAAAVLVTVLYVNQHGGIAPTSDLEMLADGDIYAMNTDVEQEPDYEFYEWAAAASDGEAEAGS